MSTLLKRKIPYLKLVVDNGILIDEKQELIEKQQALINMKIELQFNINLLNKRMEPITSQIFEVEKQLDKMNYSDKTKQRCIQAAENEEHCALLEIIKHYKKGTAGFEEDPDQAKYWQNILDNLIGRAESPQSGWSGQLKKCNN